MGDMVFWSDINCTNKEAKMVQRLFEDKGVEFDDLSEVDSDEFIELVGECAETLHWSDGVFYVLTDSAKVVILNLASKDISEYNLDEVVEGFIASRNN